MNITAGSNPPLPKSIAMKATSSGAGVGSYPYKLTMSDGKKTELSGNYSPSAPLGLPTG